MSDDESMFDRDSSCDHLDTKVHKGQILCLDCSTIIDNIVVYTDDYEHNRCYRNVSTSINSLSAETQHILLPDKVRKTADEYFDKILSAKAYRKQNKQDLLFVCIYSAYKYHKIAIDPIDLSKKFRITKKRMNNGIKIFSRYFPAHQPTQFTAMDLIVTYGCKFGFSDPDLIKLQKIFRDLKKNTNLVSITKPRILAPSIISYYLHQVPTQSKLTFKEEILEKIRGEIEISRATLRAISIEINRLLNEQISTS